MLVVMKSIHESAKEIWDFLQAPDSVQSAGIVKLGLFTDMITKFWTISSITQYSQTSRREYYMPFKYYSYM